MRCDRSIRMVIQTELIGYESFYGTVALPEDQTDGQNTDITLYSVPAVLLLEGTSESHLDGR